MLWSMQNKIHITLVSSTEHQPAKEVYSQGNVWIPMEEAEEQISIVPTPYDLEEIENWHTAEDGEELVYKKKNPTITRDSKIGRASCRERVSSPV